MPKKNKTSKNKSARKSGRLGLSFKKAADRPDGKARGKKGGGRVKNANAAVMFKGEILRVMRTHGFVRDIATDTEYFVAGRDLRGGVPGDVALFKVYAPVKESGKSRDLPEAKLIRLLTKSENILTGTLTDGGITPDSFGSRYPVEIASYGGCKAKLGDKVKFTIRQRGEQHHRHTAEITGVYGPSASARFCVEAYLEEKNIPVKFPPEAEGEAWETASEIEASESLKRLDLRDLPIFTIDGADTKDIDDAVNIERTDDGYRLGVHIADVSHYVTEGSALDAEAFKRGTSVYIADLVVPMLPKKLSNGICSLNPGEDRLAFSCVMNISKGGELKSFEFKKSVIRSKVQGVYSEINALIEGDPDEVITKKYGEVARQIPIMAELALILKRLREQRGSPALETAESKIICGENGKCHDIKRRVSGISEGIIEEFMLMANNAAAHLAMGKKLPFVYRVHEPPSAEKITRLSQTLAALGIPATAVKPTAQDLSRVLEAARSTDRADVINMAVLRTMMKAKYSTEPLGHFGLAMREYAHFTSPIRRYPDLSVHRILSAYVAGEKSLNKKYGGFAGESSVKSTFAEIRAVNAERDCNGFYAAEYMSNRVGEQFDGIISGLTESSVFIMLENTVEGRVSLPYRSDFKLDGGVTLSNSVTGTRYTLGDKVRVKCTGCSVPAGTVDFELLG